MVASWDGRVSLIGFRGVAIGSPAAAAGSLAGALRRRGEKEGSLTLQSCCCWSSFLVAFEMGVVGTFSPMLFQLLFHALFFFL